MVLRVVLVALALLACGAEDSVTAVPADPYDHKPPEETPLPPAKRAVAELRAPSDPDIGGSVMFQALLPPDGVRVDAELFGLDPTRSHGLHLHAATECDELAAETAHFDGDSTSAAAPRAHGDPTQLGAHLGDLGNVTASDTGSAVLTSVVRPLLTIDDGTPFDIVGRLVVLHRGEDDFTSDSPDNSGGLLACGKVSLLPIE